MHTENNRQCPLLAKADLGWDRSARRAKCKGKKTKASDWFGALAVCAQ